MNIIIPAENNQTQTIEIQHSLVIVGANGSGKSHLGAYIDDVNENVLRISAQRALSIPDVINITNEDASWNKVLYGNETTKNKDVKWQYGKKTTTLVYDFESTLSAVIAKESNQLRHHKDLEDKDGKYIKSNTITEEILDVWNTIYPQRSLSFEGFDIKAVCDAYKYKAGMMSDGERVALYLISQCLIAPDGYTIIIDEPEIHLHSSIMGTLWDEVEKKCPNKNFVYITHNLDFAASRKDASKIWVKSFNGSNKWDLSILEPNADIPDSLLFELLGARKPLLFVEGQKDSYDVTLYRYIYENYYVVPCNNCQKVIELTNAFNSPNLKSLHNYDVKGIIDRDYLSQKEIEAFKQKNIYVIGVSEVENLFLVEEIVKIAAEHLTKDENESFNKVKELVFKIFKSDMRNVINGICTKEIRHNLMSFPQNEIHNINDINASFNSLISSIQVESLYSEIEDRITQIVSDNNYRELIKIYNNKDLLNKVSKLLNLHNPSYPQLIINLLKRKQKDDIVIALKPYVPDLN